MSGPVLVSRSTNRTNSLEFERVGQLAGGGAEVLGLVEDVLPLVAGVPRDPAGRVARRQLVDNRPQVPDIEETVDHRVRVRVGRGVGLGMASGQSEQRVDIGEQRHPRRRRKASTVHLHHVTPPANCPKLRRRSTRATPPKLPLLSLVWFCAEEMT